MTSDKSIRNPLYPANFKEWAYQKKKLETQITNTRATIDKYHTRLWSYEAMLKDILAKPMLPPVVEEPTKEEKKEVKKEKKKVTEQLEALEKQIEELKKQSEEIPEEPIPAIIAVEIEEEPEEVGTEQPAP